MSVIKIANSISRIVKLLFIYPWNRYVRQIRLSKPPVFIVGSAHSGTSILLNILGSHSRICAIPYESSMGFSKKPKSQLKKFDRMTIVEGKTMWVEKTPKHIVCIEKLLELRSDAKFLLILRDGRDVACSLQDRTGSLEKGIRDWVDDNSVGRSFWDHPNVYVLKYEEIIENFELTISRVLHFLGENFEDEMREFHTTPKYYYSTKIKKPPTAFGEHHGQHRNWQINQPLFDGRGKWKRMTQDEMSLVKDLAGEMLVEYGYVSKESWLVDTSKENS